MRVLILSCNTGEGHNSAGLALVEAFRSADIACDMKNSLDLLPQSVSRLISGGHVFIYRHCPRLFGWGYRYEEKHTPKFLMEECARGADGLWKVIREGGYDIVICVHIFPALTLTAILKKYKPSIATYFVATDYTCSPGVGESKLDAYFIPHVTLADEFVSCGVPRERLIATGIPVRAVFERKRPRSEVCRELGLPADKQIVLLTCGSMGCGPIRDLTAELKEKMPSDSMLVVICGRNTHLFRRLSAQTEPGRVKVIGYTRRMSDYMDAADVFLTKAGGLSTTEAIIKRLPLIYIDAVPGCEKRNLDFGTKHGVALTAKGVKGLTGVTCRCLQDSAYRQSISETMRQMFPKENAARLCRYVIDAEQVRRSE